MRGEGFISSLFSVECAAWQNPRMSENSAFSLSTVASTDTCRHLTKTHFQCLQQSISTAANEKGRAVLFFLYVQLTIPGTSALLPLPFYPFLAPFLWDLTTLRLWVSPNNASPLFLLSLIKILKVKFVGFFAYKNGESRDSTDLLGFQLWEDLWCSEQWCAALLQSPRCPRTPTVLLGTTSFLDSCHFP